MKKILSVTTCAIAIIASTSAIAEDKNSNKEETVIVTAQKRAQDLQKTAVSLAVIKGSELVASGKTTFADALKDVPGVQVQGIAQGAQVFIRGVGSSIDPAFADPSVALMADGVYNGRSETIEGGGFDIERVEVLRGPQGTIYGRNATGGAVNVISASPILGDTAGFIRIGGGNYKLSRFEGMFNFPIGDIAAIRLSAISEKHDSYISNGGMDEDVKGFRAKLLFQPNDDLKIQAKYEYNEASGFGANTVPVAGSAGNLTFPPPLFATNFDPTQAGPPFVGGAPIWRFPNGWVTSDANDPWANDDTHPGGSIDRDSTTYMIQADWNIGFGTLTLLPSYTKQNNTLESSLLFGTLTGPYDIQEIGSTYKSIEARLSSNKDSKISWLLGVFLLDSDTPNTLDGTSNGGGFTSIQSFSPNKTKAVFGQATYPISDNLRLTGGLRYSSDDQGGEFQVSGTEFDSGLVTYSQSQASTTYKLGFEKDLAPQSLLYGHIASGFKQGGLNATIPATEFKPEELLSYELGVKNRFFDNKLLLNAGLFLYEYENYQISSFRTVNLGTTGDTISAGVIYNAGKTKIKGLEIQSIWRATDKDMVRFNLNLLDAKYGEVSLANNPFVNQGEFQLKGIQAANSPKWTSTIGLTHRFDLQYASIEASLDAKLSAGYYVQPEVYLPGAWQDSYHRTDANIRYIPNDDNNWSVSAFVKNIENEAQSTYVFPAYRRYVTAPRTFGVNVEYKF